MHSFLCKTLWVPGMVQDVTEGRRLIFSVLLMASGDGEYGFRLYCLSLTCFFKTHVYIYFITLKSHTFSGLPLFWENTDINLA